MIITAHRVLFASLLFGAAVSATPRPAPIVFHLALTKSEPMKDSSVVSPKAIKLWFTEKPELKNSKISLIGPDTKPIDIGKVTLDTLPKAPLVATISKTLAPGAYMIHWVTSSADGHAINGTIAFKVKAAAAKP